MPAPMRTRASTNAGLARHASRVSQLAPAAGPSFGTRTCSAIGDALMNQESRLLAVWGKHPLVKRSPAVLSGKRMRAQGRHLLFGECPDHQAIPRIPCNVAEGEGFEPSMDETAHTGFRDRRIQPLCHLSR